MFKMNTLKENRVFFKRIVIFAIIISMVLSMGSVIQIDHSSQVGTKNISGGNPTPFISSKALSLSLNPTLTSGAYGDNIIIFANVTYSGIGVAGASVTFSDNAGETFLPSTTLTNSTGVGIVTYSITNENTQKDTITALANLTGYINATSTTTINDVGSSNELAASTHLAASDATSGSTDVIHGTVRQNGGTVSGASVTISSPIYRIFSPIIVTSDSNGYYYSNFTVSNVGFPEISIIEVSVSDSGFGSSSADTTINVEPLGQNYLSVSLFPTIPAAPSQNGYMTISAKVSSGGNTLDGASVSFSDAFGSTFSAISDVTNTSGIVTANVHLSNSNSGYDIITASASMNGYKSTSGESFVYVFSGNSQLTITGKILFLTLNSGANDTISGHIYTGGAGTVISGAEITATGSSGQVFNNMPTYSDSSGAYYISFTAPSVNKITNETITISATYSGDTSTSSAFAMTILPISVNSLQEKITLLSSDNAAVGDTLLIEASVTSNGAPVEGALVAFSDSFGSTFSSLSGSTNASGMLMESLDLSTSSSGIDIISSDSMLSGYFKAQTSMELNILSGTSNQLSVSASLSSSTITSNSTDVISGTVFDGGSTGNGVSGATITVSDTSHSDFYSVGAKSGSSGSFYIEFEAAVVKQEVNDTIILTVTDSGYTSSSSMIALTILPGNSGTLSVTVTKIYPSSAMVSNGEGVALITVTSAGRPVDGALVSMSDSIGSSFTPSTIITNASGMAYASFNLPMTGGQMDIITASATDNQYNSGNGENYFYVTGNYNSQVLVTFSPQSTSISPGSTVIITGQTDSYVNCGIFVGEQERSIGGVTVTFSDSAGSVFSSTTVISSSSGSFTTSLTIPKDFKSSTDVIIASASDTGYASGDSANILTISSNFSAVDFVESGLPSGTAWSVNFDGGTQSSNTASMLFTVANSSYTYSIPSITGYNIEPSSGTVIVSGSGVQVNITFKQVDFPIVFTESGLASGTSWSVNLSGTIVSSTTNTVTFSEMNGTYSYEIVPVSGYSVSMGSGTLASSGGYNVYITFQQRLYTATFTEKGLPPGYQWSATLGSFALTSDSNSIEFNVPNGTYSYSITVPAGYSATNQTGSLIISGNGVSQGITFTSNLFIKYHVTFIMSGLSSSALWNLRVNEKSYANSTHTFRLSLPEGNYTYLMNASGYTAENASGSFEILNANETINISFSINTKYLIEFQESGLLPGQQWNVTLNGASNISTGSSMIFHETPGNYTYYVESVPGYTVNPVSGTILVTSGEYLIGLDFQKITSSSSTTKYSIMFVESGLPSATTWSVTFNGTLLKSTTNSIQTSALDGIYAFNVSSISGYEESPSSGTVTISGQNEVIGITFQKVTTFKNIGYNITFVETGLNSGQIWNVTFNGQPLSTVGSTITISEFNGTYSYSVGKINGYSISPTSGIISVNGKDVIIGINFLKQTSPTTSSTPSSSSGSNVLGIPQVYVLVGLILMIIVGSILGAVVGGFIRKRP